MNMSILIYAVPIQKGTHTYCLHGIHKVAKLMVHIQTSNKAFVLVHPSPPFEEVQLNTYDPILAMLSTRN